MLEEIRAPQPPSITSDSGRVPGNQAVIDLAHWEDILIQVNPLLRGIYLLQPSEPIASGNLPSSQ